MDNPTPKTMIIISKVKPNKFLPSNKKVSMSTNPNEKAIKPRIYTINVISLNFL